MAIGVFGTVRSADVDINDIDMFYNYTPNRQTSNDTMFRLNATELLSYTYLPTDEQVTNEENLLEGLYNLTLPASTFNQLGIYTIYIKPKLTTLTILDCGVLSALPSIKGIVVNLNDLPTNQQTNNALQGYRVEYLNSDKTLKLRNVVRYVVTSNKVVPVTENVGNTSQKATRYRFDDSGTLMYLQLTPSSSSSVKPNATPFIGNAGGTILLSNTFFDPITFEIEFVENTIDSLAEFVAGEQIKDVSNGILSYYDNSRVITKQFNLFEIKNETGNVSLFEIKEKRQNIDETQNFNDIISTV